MHVDSSTDGLSTAGRSGVSAGASAAGRAPRKVVARDCVVILGLVHALAVCTASARSSGAAERSIFL
jgi:hypothetical protein